MSSDCSCSNSTGSWVECVNRGGLFLVNNDFYTFIRNIEFELRKILNVSFFISYCGENIREVERQQGNTKFLRFFYKKCH